VVGEVDADCGAVSASGGVVGRDRPPPVGDVLTEILLKNSLRNKIDYLENFERSHFKTTNNSKLNKETKKQESTTDQTK
jgi:hypothetical protein